MSQLNWCWKWKLTTILEVGGTIIKLKLEKVRVVTCEMLRKSSYRVTFYNQTTKAFLKTWKLGWLVKHRVLTRPRENFTGWELLKHCLLMIWILGVTISNFYVFTSTLGVFSLKFSFPASLVGRSWRTNSLRVVIVFFLVMFLVAFVWDTIFRYPRDFNNIVTYHYCCYYCYYFIITIIIITITINIIIAVIIIIIIITIFIILLLLLLLIFFSLGYVDLFGQKGVLLVGF